MNKKTICLIFAVLLCLSGCSGSTSRHSHKLSNNNDNFDSFTKSENNPIEETTPVMFSSVLSDSKLLYETQNETWRYQVYQHNGDIYDKFIVLEEYLPDIPVSLVIPSEIENSPVIAINGIDDTIYTSIFGKALNSNNPTANDVIEELVIPDTVIHIGNAAFRECYALKNIVFSNKITFIGDLAFSSSGITELYLPDSLKIVGRSAFEEGDFSELIIPNGVERINENAFHSYSLTNVYIPESVQYIGKNALRQKDITIYGHAGSEAAKYASENNIVFIMTENIIEDF
ncbi:MAG: leucine-rich repeat domain-containing protein [Clostridia bacterium]|nr:leucine-rich repeat domain-containing protein [Clostridia bacterium]